MININAMIGSFLKSILSVLADDEIFLITKHVLKKGEAIEPHCHPKAREWVFIESGMFRVKAGNESKEYHLTGRIVKITFDPKIVHGLEALSDIEYAVIRDQEDETVYT